MRFERKHALFLIGVAVWNVVIWVRFVFALTSDHDQRPAFYVAHTFLIVVNLAIAVALFVLGRQALRATQDQPA